MSACPPGLSGTLWPIHPKPLADELLSCWLIRIARGFGTTAERFCRQVWSETVWKGDIDVDPGEHVLRVLAARTGTAYKDVAGMTLAAYERRLSAPLATLSMKQRPARGCGSAGCVCKRMPFRITGGSGVFPSPRFAPGMGRPCSAIAAGVAA